MSKANGQQDVKIAKLEVKIDNLDNKLNQFIINEFAHFKTENDNSHKWLMGLVVLGILIPIVLYVIK